MSDQKPNKRITLIEAKKGMSLADFHAHWSGPHAEIARHLPGLVWYVQNHVRRTLWRNGQLVSGVDGIAEIAFRDPEAIFETIETWDRVEELREDETRFIDARHGNWSILRDAPPETAQRRVIFILETPVGSADGGFSNKVAHCVDRIRESCACHSEGTIGEHGDGPLCFIFVELTISGNFDDLLSPDGPILGHVAALGIEGAGFLVDAEAKHLPIDAI